MLLKTTDVCEILNVSPNTVKALIESGELTAIRVGHQYRFRKEDIAEYIERQTITS